jgi:hypothetical protein
MSGIRKQWAYLSMSVQNEFLSMKNSNSLDRADPTSVHPWSVARRKGCATWPMEPGVMVGVYVRVRAKYRCVVISSLVRLDGSHEHAQRGKV